LPEAVFREFGEPQPACFTVKKIESPLIKFLVGDLNLGRGESEVIALAKETGHRIIMDDQKGRTIAKKLGLKLTGTIGILLKAEKLHFIGSAYEKVRELKGKGFYIADALLDDISKFRVSS
jgi:predicted nucleic acid-binding protein